MSLALIQEAAKEVRRLAIAGSPLAVGDFRLKKLINPLEQAGAQMPIFGQVAKAIGELVNGKEADSAANLLGLSTLLNAILYTQGQTATEGDYCELDMHVTNCSSTRTTARTLKPLVEALTTTGGGRFELVKTAVERGVFNDLRLIAPAIRALDDNYPELAELVADKILPAHGPGIAPLLKHNLDLKGKKCDARRLRVLHQLDPRGTIHLCKAALEDGSTEVKAEAITCLGKHEDCLPLVLEQTNSKNKTLRAAALEALAAHDRPEIVNLFTELIKGKALDLLARPMRAMRNRQVLNSLLDEGKRVFDLLLKGDAEQIPRWLELLDCLDQRQDAEGEEFLLSCFNQVDKLAKLKAAKNSQITGPDLIARLATLLYNISSPKTLEAILAKRDAVPPAAFACVLGSALRAWPPGKVYEAFAPLLEQRKGTGKEKSEELQRTIYAAAYHGGVSIFGNYVEAESDSAEAQALKGVLWDERWLDAALKADQLHVVFCLARPGRKGAITYLLKALEAKNQTQTGMIIEALARCQYPKLTDVFLDTVARKIKGAKFLDYNLVLLFNSARHLPAADLPKLDAFAGKLDESFVDRFLEALEPLRSRTAPPTPHQSQDT